MKQVLITASGLGSRLGTATRHTNKTLVVVGDKPVIARIIESYGDDCEFVITLGYKGEQVKDFLQLAYPERKLRFVEVHPFEGEGASLALSMLQARDAIDGPFIYHASDSIVEFPKLPRDRDWLLGYPAGEAALFAAFDVAGDSVLAIHPKGATNFDLLYCGVAGIFSVEDFWRGLERHVAKYPSDSSANDLVGFSHLITKGIPIQALRAIDWIDVGSISGLAQARERFEATLPTLEKDNESLARLGNRVFKFFANTEILEGRVARAQVLRPHVPEVLGWSPNWMVYEFIPGSTMASNMSAERFTDLLHWADQSFWRRESFVYDESEFRRGCVSFYRDKTKLRLQRFFFESGTQDATAEINGVLVPPGERLVDEAHEFIVERGIPGVIHGDFILSNIIRTEEGFSAIDWREGFGTLRDYGDIYYDLAKLRHSLTMDHELLAQHKFRLEFSEGAWAVDVFRPGAFVDFETLLEEFCRGRGFDWSVVDLLTPIVWLNMAPLHAHPIGTVLYWFGRSALHKALKRWTDMS